MAPDVVPLVFEEEEAVVLAAFCSDEEVVVVVVVERFDEVKGGVGPVMWGGVSYGGLEEAEEWLEQEKEILYVMKGSAW